MARSVSTFVIILIYVLMISLRAGKAGKKKNSSSGASSAGGTAAARPDRPTPTIPSLARRSSRRDDDCEYGEVNHRYSHQSERRVAQLDGYLKAGLIDKKEYAEMLERYTRQDKIYDTYNQ